MKRGVEVVRISGIKGSSVVDCVNKIRVLLSGLEGAGYSAVEYHIVVYLNDLVIVSLVVKLADDAADVL